MQAFFKYVAVSYLIFQVATTTLHVYNAIVERRKTGLKLPGSVQLLFDKSNITLNTLVTSAHQLDDLFYKTILLEGSEVDVVHSAYFKVTHVNNVPGETIKHLVRQVRPQFRKLQENMIFLEREIISYLSNKKRSYKHKSDWSVGLTKSAEAFDKYFRERRTYAEELGREVVRFKAIAITKKGEAGTLLMLLIFGWCYTLILSLFVGKYVRNILYILALFSSIICLHNVFGLWVDADEFNIRADKVSAKRSAILEDVRENQDQLLRSRNGTLEYFVNNTDQSVVQQATKLVLLFTELIKYLEKIDDNFKTIFVLVKQIELSKKKYQPGMVEGKTRSSMTRLGQELKNITTNIDIIYNIL